MEAAIAAFRDSAREGMVTQISLASMTSSGKPAPSAPTEITSLPAGNAGGGSPASGTAATAVNPAPVASDRNATVSSSRATLAWNTEPMVARTVLGLYTSAQPFERATPASKAWAERITLPTFPGSCTPCNTTMRSEAAIRTRAGTSTKGKTPTGPVGVFSFDKRRTSSGLSNSRRGSSLDSRITASPSARKSRSASRYFLRLSLAARLREIAGVSGIRRLPGLRFGCLLHVGDGDATLLARALHLREIHAQLFRLAFGGLGGVYFAFPFGCLLHVIYQDATLGAGACSRLDIHIQFLGSALGGVRSLRIGGPLNVLYDDTSLRAGTFDGRQVYIQFLRFAFSSVSSLHFDIPFRPRSGFLRLGPGLLGGPPRDLDAPLDGLAVQGVPGLRDHRGKSLRVGDCQFREDLAVEVYLGEPQPVDEPGVGEAVLADAGVYALDPERPEVTLALLAPLVGVDAALPDLLLGFLVRAALLAPVALRLLEHLAAPLAGVDAARRACQLSHPHEALDALLVGGIDDGRPVEPPLAPGALLLQDVVVAGPAPPELAVLPHLEAPGGALVGLHLRHSFTSAFLLFATRGARGTGVEPFRPRSKRRIVSNCCFSCGRPAPCAHPPAPLCSLSSGPGP